MRRALIPSRRRGSRGVTLIELMVAILVLSIASVAAFRSIGFARRSIGDEPARFYATEVALNRAEELRLGGALAGRSLPREVLYGPVTWTVAVAEEVTEAGLVQAAITVTAPDRPGARLVTYVDAGDGG